MSCMSAPQAGGAGPRGPAPITEGRHISWCTAGPWPALASDPGFWILGFWDSGFGILGYGILGFWDSGILDSALYTGILDSGFWDSGKGRLAARCSGPYTDFSERNGRTCDHFLALVIEMALPFLHLESINLAI